MITRTLTLLGRAPAFRSLFLATLGSGLGSMLAVIALTVDVYDRTESGAWVALLLIADFLPTIAIGLLLGPLLDRFSRRGLMIASDLVRMGAFVALPFVVMLGLFLFTSAARYAQSYSAVNRLLLQITPLLVSVLVLALRAPDVDETTTREV